MSRPIPITIGTKSLFIPHSGFASDGLSKLDQFAELLAEGYSVPDAGRVVGWDRHYANSMLQRIRKRLGRQAC